MSENISLSEDTQLLIVDDLEEDQGGTQLMGSNSNYVITGTISPPPLIGLDRPGPPNVAMMSYPGCSRYCRLIQAI